MTKGLKRDRVVTFKTTRGSFEIPAALFDDDREHELRVYFATHLPEDCTTVARKAHRDGSATVTWRKVAVVELS
jgi:hypothetical protein